MTRMMIVRSAVFSASDWLVNYRGSAHR